MTQDFKKNIFNWFIGKFEPTNKPENVPNIELLEETSNNWGQELKDFFENEDFTIKDIIQTRVQENNLDYVVAYGTYGENSNGFVAIINQRNQLEQVITEFSTGTLLREFLSLNVGNDGLFYGIDKNEENVRRFILLNNIVVKNQNQTNFQIVLRNSYIISSSSQSSSADIAGIKKDPNNANYLIYGTTNNSKPFATALTINVGSENEWTDYAYSSSVYTAFVQDAYISDWEKMFFKLGAISFTTSNSNAYYGEYSITSEETTVLIRNHIVEITPYAYGFGSMIMYNDNTTYISYYERSETEFIFKLNLSMIDTYNSLLLPILSYDTDPALLGSRIQAKIANNNIYALVPVYESSPSGDHSLYFCHVLDSTNVLMTKIKDLDINGIPNSYFYISNQFNLYNYNFIDFDSSINSINLYIGEEVFNPNNYNGQSFLGFNSMVPNSGIFRDVDGTIVFARDLYNKSINDNLTISTIQIPNTSLNDRIIRYNELLSETNGILNNIQNSSDWEKNIYETINVNFINYLNIINKNNISDEIVNLNGASRLNNSISQDKDYDDVKGVKYKINYLDKTNKIYSFSDSQIKTISDFSAIYEFVIYLYKPIANVEIISNDEETVYQVINISNLETGKYYKISQKVEII